MLVPEVDVGGGVTHLDGDRTWHSRPSAVSLSSLTLCQPSTAVAKVWHRACSGRSWIHSCSDLCKSMLRLPVWHLKQGSWNYYFCFLPVHQFGTIMWTESSVKWSYDNLYLLDLGPFPSSVEGQCIATAFFLSHWIIINQQIQEDICYGFVAHSIFSYINASCVWCKWQLSKVMHCF